MSSESYSQHPQSLQLLVIQFISNNLRYVETLKGYPELLGDAIAQEVNNSNSAQKNDGDIYHSMYLFASAYGKQVLHSLNLSTCHYLKNSSSNYSLAVRQMHKEPIGTVLDILELKTLSKLDISQCTVCTQSQWLNAIGQLRLTDLCMRYVGMTDTELTSLTACARIRKRGLASLRHIDLSGNLLTCKSVDRLWELSSLKLAIMTGCRVQPSQVRKDRWDVSDTASELCVHNEGWLSGYLMKYLSVLSPSMTSGSKNFYSNRSRCSVAADPLILRRKSVCHSVSKNITQAVCPNSKRTAVDNDIPAKRFAKNPCPASLQENETENIKLFYS